MTNKTARAAVPEMRQETQFTCVAASISACLQALDKPFTERDVNRVLGAEPLRGARWEEALATIQYFGCRGHLVIPATLAMVREWTDDGKPVIIAWNPEGRPWSHASVIFDVTDDIVKVMDPNIPDPSISVREISHAEFYKTWNEPMGDSMVVRRPALMVEVEVGGDGRQVRASAKTSAGYHDPELGDVYPNEIDHGYERPIAGGSDVMQKLQKEFLIEQGEAPLPESAKRVASSLIQPLSLQPDYGSDAMSKGLNIDEFAANLTLASDRPDWEGLSTEDFAARLAGCEDCGGHASEDEDSEPAGIVARFKDHAQWAKWFENQPKEFQDKWMAENAKYKDKFKKKAESGLPGDSNPEEELAPDAEMMARFPEGEPADPTKNMSEEDKKKWLAEKEKHKDEFKAASSRERTTWDKEAGKDKGPGVPDGTGPRKDDPECPKNKADKEAARAPSGLYGFTKAIQGDCEASIRKLERRAASLARNAWQKDEETARFLTLHAKRAKSVPARLLVAAMKQLGPKVASSLEADKTARDYSHGLYGFRTKTARLGLTACSALREHAGHISYDLHSRRASLYEPITGFFTQHKKATRCNYSRMLLAGYPDMAKAASEEPDDGHAKEATTPPSSVKGWLEWEE